MRNKARTFYFRFEINQIIFHKVVTEIIFRSTFLASLDQFGPNFNGMISEPLRICSASFVTIELAVFRNVTHNKHATKNNTSTERVRALSYEGRSFAYAGPSNWNSLPAYLRDSSLSLSSFKHHLKTFLFLLG